MNPNDDELPPDPALDPTLDVGEEEIARVLLEAGPRPEIPADDFAQIRAAARSAWTETVQARQRSRFRRLKAPQLLALAASLMMVAALAVWWRTRNVVPIANAGMDGAPTLATFERGLGTITSNGRALAVGAPIHRGDEVAIGGGMLLQGSPYAVVRMANGIEIRVDRGTRFALASANEITLRLGAVYIDTDGASGRSASLAVTTNFGTVRDIGTRFEVRRGESDLRVRVRDGAISLTKISSSPPIAAKAGEEIALDRTGQVARQEIATDDPAWDWVIAAAAPFEIEGAPLDAFLRWVEHEAGWKIEVQDPSLATRLGAIELHGSIVGLSPAEAIAVVLPSSGLDYELRAGVVRIRRAQNSKRMPNEGRIPAPSSGRRTNTP